MTLVCAGLLAYFAGALAAVLLRRRYTGSAVLGAAGALAGGVCVVTAAGRILLGAAAESWRAPWPVPFASLSFRLDPLAAAILIPIGVVGALGSIYGTGYLRRERGNPCAGWIFATYNLLLAGMVAVVTAANAILFLTAWEAMTLLSWYLVVCDRHEPASRQAGLLYLVMGHVAGGALILMFALSAPAAGPWDFGAATHPAPVVMLLLVLVAFGTKAGVVPLHVWLPDAHSAAPSHVSALMSGVLITLGFYGILRFTPLAGGATAWFAGLLMGLGIVGIGGGVLMALSQRDVKRILAYSTVENAGLLLLALGAGLLADLRHQPLMAALAWAGFFLHLWNHAAMKSLLFLGFGAVAQAARARDLETWGGVARKWPGLSGCLVVGGAAVSGLPGLIGFVGEWFILMALFQGCLVLGGAGRFLSLLGLLGTVGGGAGAVACFVRLIGIGLLGRPRSRRLEAAGRLPASLTWPVAALAAVCVAGPWAVVPMLGLLRPVVEQVSGTGLPRGVLEGARSLAQLSAGVALLLALAAGAVALDRRRRPSRVSATWACAHRLDSERTQYTANSLAQPITSVLEPVLKTSVKREGPTGLWPAAGRWEARTPERAIVELYRPALEHTHAMLSRLSSLQRGEVTGYLRYIVLALLALLGILFLLPGGNP